MIRKICGHKLVYKSILDANRPLANLSFNVLRTYATNDQFQQAVQNVSKLKDEPDNDVKLSKF